MAGSEKIAKTGAQGQTLEEAKNINQSLTTLGKVIVALTDKKITHIPYRESKLTRILSESLGGNSKTLLIVTCSPHPYNEAETLGTLRFGSRARNIKNTPKVNREYTVPELKKLLLKAEDKIAVLEGKIKGLQSKIVELGGEKMSDADMEKLGFAIAAKEAIDKKKEELQKEMNEKIDMGDDDLNDMDIRDLPERKFTEMGKKQIEEEKKGESEAIGDTTMIQMEVLEEKQVEIERL